MVMETMRTIRPWIMIPRLTSLVFCSISPAVWLSAAILASSFGLLGSLATFDEDAVGSAGDDAEYVTVP